MGGNTQKYVAELFGTAVLVLIGCSSIVAEGFGAAAPIGFIGIGMTFGMTVTAMAFAIGLVSGWHLNLSLTAAVWASGRMSTTDAVGYIVSQLIGGFVGALILYIIMKGKNGGYDVATQGLGQNGWAAYTAKYKVRFTDWGPYSIVGRRFILHR